MAYLTIHMATPNFLTKRGTPVFRGANSALWPCSCAIRALRWGPQRLGIIGHMWRELLAQWPTLQYPPLPATPCRCVQPRLHTTQAHIPGWLLLSRGSRHIVDVRLCPRLLGTTSHMSRELPTPWATLQFTFMPPSNTPTKARKQVGGVAPWVRGARGARLIQEPRWYPQRLVIQDHMCSELPRG